jgi:hypothetical protein
MISFYYLEKFMFIDGLTIAGAFITVALIYTMRKLSTKSNGS